MGSIKTRSWIEPLPESLQEVTMDFASGKAATSACSDDVITVVVPKGTELPIHEGCKQGIVESLKKIFGGGKP
jgi:hypothetical protein